MRAFHQKNRDIKIITHPGSTSNGMLEYIKPIIRRKPHVLPIHAGTNDLANNVNMIKTVTDRVKCIHNLDRNEEIQIHFPTIISI